MRAQAAQHAALPAAARPPGRGAMLAGVARELAEAGDGGAFSDEMRAVADALQQQN